MENWPALAACRNKDPDALFVRGAQQNVAKKICQGCPVRYECLADALDNRIEWGVWGGMTERERRAILRRNPNLRSWRSTFESAAKQQQQDITRQKVAPSTGEVAVWQAISEEASGMDRKQAGSSGAAPIPLLPARDIVESHSFLSPQPITTQNAVVLE